MPALSWCVRGSVWDYCKFWGDYCFFQSVHVMTYWWCQMSWQTNKLTNTATTNHHKVPKYPENMPQDCLCQKLQATLTKQLCSIVSCFFKLYFFSLFINKSPLMMVHSYFLNIFTNFGSLKLTLDDIRIMLRLRVSEYVN